MKKNNTAEKSTLDAERITKALQEGTEKTLKALISEAVSKYINEEADEEEPEEVEDDSYDVEDVEAPETDAPETSDEQPEEGGEEDGEEGLDDDADDEWSDFEQYKVGDNDYDFTGVNGDELLKVYNKLGDDDQIFVKKQDDGTYEVKDEETGAELVIELNPDAEAEEDTEDNQEFDIDFDDEDSEEDGAEFDVDFDDEDSEEDGAEFDSEDEPADDDEIEIDLGDEDDEDELNEEDLGYTDSYQKDVFNGEVGTVVTRTDDEIAVDYDGKLVTYTHEDIDELQLAYSTTIHKSQGSEYPVTFVVVSDETSTFLLIRKIIYTALSRGKSKVYLFGSRGCVQECDNYG